MRLLKAQTLELVEFHGEDVPNYAILSHTWGNDEVTLECLRSGKYSEKAGYQKIRSTLDQALQDGIYWAWVDTCCIDKTSSAELSEAINSMFRWYASAEICYAYLEDVRPFTYEPEDTQSHSILTMSRWFLRGWTLQELIAPRRVHFYDGEWNFISDRQAMSVLLEEAVGIPEEVLDSLSPSAYIGKYSIAERMSWASGRVTTRPEDRAYSLLGLFEVNMPLLYGEGERIAFQRLQEEIMKVDDDLSILAWCPDAPTVYSADLLASSPDLFGKRRGLVETEALKDSILTAAATLNSGFLRLTVQVLDAPQDGQLYMILPCRSRRDFTKILALRLIVRSRRNATERNVVGAKEYFCAGSRIGRLVWVDACKAIQKSRQESIAIRRYYIRPKKDSASVTKSSQCRYLWLRSSEKVETRKPSIIHAHPKGYWNLENWTLDLGKTREAAICSPRSQGTNATIYAGVVLHDPRVCIVLSSTLYAGDNDEFVHTLMPPTKIPRSPTSEMLDQPKHTLKLNEDVTIVSRLRIDNIFEHKAVIIDIDLCSNDTSLEKAFDDPLECTAQWPKLARMAGWSELEREVFSGW